MTMISVVMTTYNGERFIKEQLDSIYHQSALPDEVLIFDDCSTDETVKIIKDFIKKNKLENWRIVVNKENMGWKKNFVQGIKKAEGDIIFLSDQDDIWKSSKIEEMARVMKTNPKIEILAGNSQNFYSCDENFKLPPLYSLRKRAFYLNKIWMNKGFAAQLNKILKEEKKDTGEIIKVAFDDGILAMQRQGCVMAVRKSILSKALNNWNENCPHDSVLWFYGAINDSLFLLEKNVINYRHHISNTGFRDTLGEGLTAKSEIKKCEEQLKQLEYLKGMLNEDIEDLDRKKNVILTIENYLKLRIRFLKQHRLQDGIAVIKGRGRASKRQVIFDWLLAYLT